jgi:hypothetical protein
LTSRGHGVFKLLNSIPGARSHVGGLVAIGEMMYRVSDVQEVSRLEVCTLLYHVKNTGTLYEVQMSGPLATVFSLEDFDLPISWRVKILISKWIFNIPFYLTAAPYAKFHVYFLHFD